MARTAKSDEMPTDPNHKFQVSTGRGRQAQEVVAERLAFCAEAMVRLRSSFQVERECFKRYKVDARTVRRWMKKVRAERRVEMSAIDHQAARDDMRESLALAARLAIGRTAVVKNADGTVLVDIRTTVTDETGQQIPNPNLGAPITKPNPDIGRYLHALRELRHLDALDAPVKSEIKIEHDIGKMPDLKDLGPKAAQALQGFLKEISPDADISNLAGEWFKFSGGDGPPKP